MSVCRMCLHWVLWIWSATLWINLWSQRKNSEEEEAGREEGGGREAGGKGETGRLEGI